MADDRAYRVQIRYDAEAETFTASVPELDLLATADSRADAFEGIEAELDARLHAAADGEPLPSPADARPVDGELTVELSPSLHRSLLYFAERAGDTPENLARELISRGVGLLEGRALPRASAPTDESTRDDSRGDKKPPRRRRGRREGYHGDMDDQANFMEYVRNLERGGGGRGRR